LDEKPEEVGKIVYRHAEGEPELAELLMIKYIEHYLKMPKPDWSEKSKVKPRQVIRKIVKIHFEENARQRDK
jgi:hypothetical protein